jgi:WD40 repeat protein
VFHPSGAWFATGSRDKTIKLWNPDDYSFLMRIEKEIHAGHINSVNKIYWSSFNNYLVSAGDDRRIIIWEIN